MTPKVKEQITNWLIGAIPGLILVAGFVVISPYFLPEGDPDALYRYFILHIPSAILGILIIVGALNFADFATPGDFLAKIEENSIACAITAAAICISIALIICYA